MRWFGLLLRAQSLKRSGKREWFARIQFKPSRINWTYKGACVPQGKKLGQTSLAWIFVCAFTSSGKGLVPCWKRSGKEKVIAHSCIHKLQHQDPAGKEYWSSEKSCHTIHYRYSYHPNKQCVGNSFGITCHSRGSLHKSLLLTRELILSKSEGCTKKWATLIHCSFYISMFEFCLNDAMAS